jgi:hypothetical protein
MPNAHRAQRSLNTLPPHPPCAPTGTFTVATSSSSGRQGISPYVPHFDSAFDVICIHSGGRAVLDEMEKRLRCAAAAGGGGALLGGGVEMQSL